MFPNKEELLTSTSPACLLREKEQDKTKLKTMKGAYFLLSKDSTSAKIFSLKIDYWRKILREPYQEYNHI